MYQLILMLHVIVALMLIGLVLLQHGKGADIGAAFGSGASNTVFGSQGTGSFLFKLTGALILLFFITSLTLSYLVSVQTKRVNQLLIPQEQYGADKSLPINSMPMPIEKNEDNKK